MSFSQQKKFNSIISLLTITLIIFSTFSATIADSSSLSRNRSSILEVGSGKPYQTISEAITNAAIGDTIVIYNGIYNENLIIDKSITLQGLSPINTIVMGMDIGPQF